MGPGRTTSKWRLGKVKAEFAYVVSAQVGLEFSSKDFERCALSDTISPDKAENLSRSGCGKPMKLESVGSISVGNFGLEIGGKIDDGNGFKGTSCTNPFEHTTADPRMNLLLYTDTTTDTQELGYECDFIRGLHFNTKFT